MTERILVSFAAFLAIALIPVAAGTAAAAGDRPTGTIDVLHYDVVVRPHIADGAITGETRIRFRSRSAALSEIAFPANALDIKSARAAGRAIGIAKRGSQLVIRLPHPLAKGRTGQITIAYDGKPARGLTFGSSYVYANYFACDWMICSQDMPGDKATIRMTLIVPAGMISQGPGTLRSKSKAGPGLERHVWDEDRPYSSYLFAFAVGDFRRVAERQGRTELVYLSPIADAERLSSLFRPTGSMLRYFEEKAGLPFPHDRYVQLHAPGTAAQEAANFSLLGEDTLAPRLEKPEEDWAIAHELAHQWWGNLVTCADWSQFWLNEGITTFMVAAWKEHRWGRPAYDREMALLRQRVDAATRTGIDVPLTYPGPYPSLSLRRAITYSKGALFMDRLRQELGETAFWRALKDYSRAHAGGVVDSRDFQRAFERSSGRKLDALFQEWVYGKG